MSSSEQYLRGLERDAPQDWGAAVRALRAEVGSKAADILAAIGGRVRRTAERWVAKAEGRAVSEKITPPPAVQVQLVNWAKAHYVANKLRAAQRVNAGSVAVYSKSDGTMDPRSRSIGSLPAEDLRTQLNTAADLIQAGDYAAAAALIDDGVIDAYGEHGGVADLSGTLGVVTYEDGFSID